MIVLEGNFYNYKFNEWSRDITSLASPLILLFVPLIVLGWSQEYRVLLLLLLVNEVICSLIKYFFHQPRPDDQKFAGAMEKIDAGSFPSIHASRITISFIFLCLILSDPVIKIVLIVYVLAVYASRVILKRHFPTDVIGGAIIGLCILSIYFYFIV